MGSPTRDCPDNSGCRPPPAALAARSRPLSSCQPAPVVPGEGSGPLPDAYVTQMYAKKRDIDAAQIVNTRTSKLLQLWSSGEKNSISQFYSLKNEGKRKKITSYCDRDGGKDKSWGEKDGSIEKWLLRGRRKTRLLKLIEFLNGCKVRQTASAGLSRWERKIDFEESLQKKKNH